jgi:methionyl-tRNA synthetase
LTGFGRGSDQEYHWPGVQELWRRCVANGDIYKKRYQGLYCVGCESFYAPEELVDGKCPEHLVEPELVEEENYFFRLSKYEAQIRELIESNTLRVVSDRFKNEMLGFINQGLADFSVSRSTTRGRGVGVAIPDDPDQVMYVWFDALCIYMTAIGWGYDQDHWQKYWADATQIVHVIGKGINRFHSIYWIGMLLSAGVRVPDAVSVHGYITANGQKMSKSLGNVIEPMALIAEKGLEPVRYYLLKEIPTHSDGDFTDQRFRELYTAELANGLGNLCSRVAKLCEKSQFNHDTPSPKLHPHFRQLMDSFELSDALSWLQSLVASEDKYLAEQTPWTKTGDEQRTILDHAVKTILTVSFHLQVFMPTTGRTIFDHFANETITSLSPLFPRLPE